MFHLIGVGVAFFVVGVENFAAFVRFQGGVGSEAVNAAFCPQKLLVHLAKCAFVVATLAVDERAVGVGEINDVVVKNFAKLFASSHFTPASSLCFNGIALFHPVGHVNVVNVLLVDVVAAEPIEIIPVSHLIFHFGLACLAWIVPHAAADPIDTAAHDVANFAVVNAVNGLAVVALVMALQTHHYVQFFLLGLLGSFQHAANTWAVGGHGFFHEYVLVLPNCFFKMEGTKAGWSGQNHHVGQGHCLFVAVETDKHSLFWHINFCFCVHNITRRVFVFFARQVFIRFFQTVLESVGHSHDFDVLAGAEGLLRGTRAASAATHEGNFDGVVCAVVAKRKGRNGTQNGTTGN